MKFIRGLKSCRPEAGACVATIGNFDGLHLGHQKLIARLNNKAKQLKLPLTVISFEPLPAEYFMPKPPARIHPLRDKVRLLQQMKVDRFLCLRFDASLATMPAQEFVQKILLDTLHVHFLAVGDDFRFGHQRKGDFELLKRMGATYGMQVSDTPTCMDSGERISSTRIRQSLENGEIETANKLLGHAYQLSGRVRQGDKRGRSIGFPTLNMKIPEHIAPARGVYAVRVTGLGKSGLDNRVYHGVANLGVRPTINGTETRLETHVFDYEDDAYGKYVCVELVRFLRTEQRFDNFEILKTQIVKDAKLAREILNGPLP